MKKTLQRSLLFRQNVNRTEEERVCSLGKKGRTLMYNDDPVPVEGVCGGITVSGALDVGGEEVYAGEAHVC